MIPPSSIKHWRLIRAHLPPDLQYEFDERLGILLESVGRDPASEPDADMVRVALEQVQGRERA